MQHLEHFSNQTKTWTDEPHVFKQSWLKHLQDLGCNPFPLDSAELTHLDCSMLQLSSRVSHAVLLSVSKF